MKKIKCPKRKNVFWVICILIIMVGCSKNEDNENKKIDQSPYAVLNAKEAPDYNFYDENELEMYMHNDFDGFVDDGNQLITLLQTFEKDDVELTNPIYTYQSIKDGETKDINLKELTKDGQFNKCILYNRALNQYMATSYNSNNMMPGSKLAF